MEISECTPQFSFLITDLHHLGQNYKDAQGPGNAQRGQWAWKRRQACLPQADATMTIILRILKPTSEASNTPKPVPLIPPHPHKHAHTHTHTHTERRFGKEPKQILQEPRKRLD